MGKLKEGMSEAKKAELAEGKKSRDHDLHMARFHDSQKRLAQSKQHAANRIERLRAGYFQRVYGDQWREVMEGIREETDAKLAAEREGQDHDG